MHSLIFVYIAFARLSLLCYLLIINGLMSFEIDFGGTWLQDLNKDKIIKLNATLW